MMELLVDINAVYEVTLSSEISSQQVTDVLISGGIRFSFRCYHGYNRREFYKPYGYSVLIRVVLRSQN
jgi:hypothetical protein